MDTCFLTVATDFPRLCRRLPALDDGDWLGGLGATGLLALTLAFIQSGLGCCVLGKDADDVAVLDVNAVGNLKLGIPNIPREILENW